MLGDQNFEELQKKSVTIVGLGAVGGYVLEGLVRAGVLSLRLCDFDTVEPSNINRQLLALETTIGRSKVDLARERALSINSEAHVEALEVFATEETLDQILDPRPDLLIDAIDSLNPKTQLLYTAYMRGIPIISSMGAALRTDPAFIRSGDLFATRNCPLARHLRQRLRRRGITEGIPCVYSTEPVNFDFSKGSCEVAALQGGRGRQRNILGSLPTVTGIFGLTIANEAIYFLSG
jgi:tRNA A37 threonylcarbamoyladenosine dehydratase